jgi:hypothetical protein
MNTKERGLVEASSPHLSVFEFMGPGLQPAAEVYPERLPCRQSKGRDDYCYAGSVLDRITCVAPSPGATSLT